MPGLADYARVVAARREQESHVRVRQQMQLVDRPPGSDVVTVGGELVMDDEADVRGQIVEVPFGPHFSFAWPAIGNWNPWRYHDRWFDYTPMAHAFDFVWEAFGLLLLAIFACLALLFARHPFADAKQTEMATAL